MKFMIKNLRNEGMILLKTSVMKELDLKIGDIVDVEICKDSEAMGILEAKVSDESTSIHQIGSRIGYSQEENVNK